MVRFFLIIAFGIGIGYAYGYRDARQHDEPITSRVLDRLGGNVREYADRESRAGVSDP